MCHRIKCMIEFVLKLADKVVAVQALFESTREYCKKYICYKNADFSVTITEEDINFEREQAAREDEIEGLPVRKMSDPMLEITAVQRKIVQKFFENNIILIHGSVIAVDGKAYLFTAKSGTGKSTHTRLWREMLGDRAVMVNDDKPFVSVKQDGEIIVHGSPWNGKHKLGANISVPLQAICILERGEVNEIKQIPASAAIFMLIQQSSRPQNPALMPKYLELLDRVAQGVKFYRLACNMDPEAARVSFEGMTQKN